MIKSFTTPKIIESEEQKPSQFKDIPVGSGFKLKPSGQFCYFKTMLKYAGSMHFNAVMLAGLDVGEHLTFKYKVGEHVTFDPTDAVYPIKIEVTLL